MEVFSILITYIGIKLLSSSAVCFLEGCVRARVGEFEFALFVFSVFSLGHLVSFSFRLLFVTSRSHGLSPIRLESVRMIWGPNSYSKM